jgi:serine/threonine kinase 32
LSVGPPPDWVRPSSRTTNDGSPVQIRRGDSRTSSQASSPPVPITNTNTPRTRSRAPSPIRYAFDNKSLPPKSSRTYRPDRPSASQRVSSGGGASSLTVGGGDGPGNWPELPGPEKNPSYGGKRQKSVLGFLKKGRQSSPKPQEPGVIGKEGARVVVQQTSH